MNDFDNMLLYGGMVLDSNPAAGVKVGTLISLANAIPLRTREFDLDKEEKLGHGGGLREGSHDADSDDRQDGPQHVRRRMAGNEKWTSCRSAMRP